MSTPTLNAEGAGKFVEVYATKEPVGIWSGEHRAWWRANRCGYTASVEAAGRYSLADALDATCHVGPEKQIVIDDLPAGPVSLIGALQAFLDDTAGFSDGELQRRVSLGYMDETTRQRIIDGRNAVEAFTGEPYYVRAEPVPGAGVATGDPRTQETPAVSASGRGAIEPVKQAEAA